MAQERQARQGKSSPSVQPERTVMNDLEGVSSPEAHLQRTVGNQRLGGASGATASGAITPSGGIESIVRRAERFAPGMPFVQRKIEKIGDTTFFKPLPFYNSEGMKAEKGYMQSYFDAFVRRDEEYTLEQFIDSSGGKPFAPKNARRDIRNAQESSKKKEENTTQTTTTSPPVETTPPVSKVEAPKKPSLEEALLLLNPKDFEDRSSFIDEVKKLTGLGQKAVYDRAREVFDGTNSSTKGGGSSKREQRISEMLEKGKLEEKPSTIKGPSETVGYTVDIPDPIRRGAKKNGFEGELDSWALDVTTSGASTRGVYNVASTILQHYWIGSTATQTVFFHVNHGAATVEVKALGEHVGDNNKYSSFAHVSGYNFKEI